jgi:hypothetical protein
LPVTDVFLALASEKRSINIFLIWVLWLANIISKFE